MPRTAASDEFAARVSELADGTRSSRDIATLLGVQPRRVRKVMTKLDLPRLPAGSPAGERSGTYKGGRRIDHSGYALVTAPADHPHAVYVPGRRLGTIREHRLVMEQRLGRYLSPVEVVDHRDGLTLHNAPENLQLFATNADHLRATISGRARGNNLSEQGRRNLRLKGQHADNHLPADVQRVDMHRQRKAVGVIRLHQILRLALRLGTDSPYLVGTHQHTSKAGIDMSSRSTIEHALADLCARWELDPGQ